MRTKRVVLFSVGFLLIGSLLAGNGLPSPTPVHAQGSIVLDGQGDDWGSQWQLVTDELDVSVTSDQACGGGAGGQHPHMAPCFARTGYDITGLWGLYQVLDDSWYFRLDVDGVPGDADSVEGLPGTVGLLGFGTHGDDGGWLTSPAADLPGLSDFEQYSLLLGTSSALGHNATLSNVGGPGGLITLGGASTLTGEAIYGTTVAPGIVEWRIDKSSLLPPGAVQPQLWAGATAGVNNDQVSDDAISAFLVLGIDVTNICPSPRVNVGQNATFPINYSIDGTYPQASEVTITAPVPAGTTYVSCAGGLSCSQNGGVISWDLGTLAPGATGMVSFVARFDVGTGITTDAYMTIAEGLRDETRASGCIAVQPTPPPPPPPPPPTATPAPPPTATPPFVLPPSGQQAVSIPWSGVLLLTSALLLGAGIGLNRRRD